VVGALAFGQNQSFSQRNTHYQPFAQSLEIELHQRPSIFAPADFYFGHTMFIYNEDQTALFKLPTHMPKKCSMWTLAGKCTGELLRVHPKIYVASCCNVCGNHSYDHLSMEQLSKHMHRNSDLKDEYMERSWNESEHNLQAKEIVDAKLAADVKAVNDENARVAAAALLAAAELKKRIYIARVDDLHMCNRLNREATIAYLREKYTILQAIPKTSEVVTQNRLKLAALKDFEDFKITDKVALLFASGLPNLIKTMSVASDQDDEVMRLVREQAGKHIWQLAMRSATPVMRLVKQEVPVPTKKNSNPCKKRCRNISETECERLAKKFKSVV